MISAQLIKYLEGKGFSLDFPGYNNIEEPIIEILLENNQRLLLALPLLLRQRFNYSTIKQRLLLQSSGKTILKKFNIIIMITCNLLALDNDYNDHLKSIIKENRIKYTYNYKDYNYFKFSFYEFKNKATQYQEQSIKEQIFIRSKLQMNKALAVLFSPAKLRIMQKIYSHEKLTNTELKYYYKAIRPLIFAILQDDAQKYLRLIESVKKYIE